MTYCSSQIERNDRRAIGAAPDVCGRGMPRARQLLLGLLSALLVSALLLGAGLPSPASAQSDATKIREIKRLLWAFDYNIGRLNGTSSAEYRASIDKFFADRGKPRPQSDDSLIAELTAAYEAKRKETLNPSTTQILDRRPIANIARVIVLEDRDQVVVGDCGTMVRYRLSTSAPLATFRTPCGAGSFEYSKPHNGFVAAALWEGQIYGLLVTDADTGLRRNFIEVPDSLSVSKIVIHPNGHEVYVTNTNNSLNANLWHVDLRTSVARRVGTPQSTTLPQDLRISADGRHLAVGWSRSSGDYARRIQIRDLISGRVVIEQSRVEDAVFSPDGRLVALWPKDDRVEIRELASKRVIAQKTFKYEEGPGFRKESVVFDARSAGLIFLASTEDRIRRWDFVQDTNVELTKLPEKVERAVIDAAAEKVHVIVGAGVVTYKFDGSSPHKGKSNLRPVEMNSAAHSPDNRYLAMQAPGFVSVMDMTSGSVKTYDQLGAVTAIAFLPDSRRMLVGTEQGAISILDLETGATAPVPVPRQANVRTIVSARRSSLAAAIADERLVVFDVVSGRVLATAKTEGYGITNNAVAFVDGDARILYPGKWKVEVLDISSGRRILDRQLKSNERRIQKRTTWMWSSVSYVVPKSPTSDAYWVGTSSFGSNILYEYANGSFRHRVGGPPSGTSFITYFAAGSAVALPTDDMALAVVLHHQPAVSSIEGTDMLSRHANLNNTALAIMGLPGRRFVTADKSGEIRVYHRSHHEPEVQTVVYAGGHWMTRLATGHFTGTREAMENLYLARGPSESYPLDNLYNSLYRPDLVREKLAGDPERMVREAAAKLDLNKVIASGSAPRVTIVPPVKVEEQVTLEADVADQGGGVGRVEWRVNGVTLGVQERGLQRVAASASSTLRLKRTMLLEEGDNTIEVVAYNEQNLIASDPARLTLKLDAVANPLPPRLHVLTVAVNDYWDGRLRLNYATPDAKAVGTALQASGAGLYESVQIKALSDGEVTTKGLSAAFEDLSKTVRSRDTFVFFLAGHGKTVDGKYYFLPQDFRYQGEESISQSGIGQDQWQAWFSRIAAKRSVLLYDTCESGSLTGDKFATRGLEQVAAMEKMTRAMGRTVLSASTDSAPALEGYRGHGVFTYALLDGLARGDGNNNGLIEVTELAGFVDQEVPELSHKAFKVRQVPQLRVVGSNFPLGKRLASAPHATPSATAPAAMPTRPTHFVRDAVGVFAAPGGSGAPSMQLTEGTTVAVVQAEGDWMLVARDGRRLGYVAKSALRPLQ